MIRNALLAIALGLLPVAGHTQDFAPRDECAQDPWAKDFRDRLASAVTRRDAKALLSLASPEIVLDFGGGSGREVLRERLHDPRYALWDELDAIMALGCSLKDRKLLTMPWYFAQDLGNIDPYEGLLVTGNRVAFRSSPSLDSRVIKRLSWVPVIAADQSGARGDFVAVRLPEGGSGYIHKQYLRSFVDYRLIAEYQDMHLQITAFVAGD